MSSPILAAYRLAPGHRTIERTGLTRRPLIAARRASPSAERRWARANSTASASPGPAGRRPRLRCPGARPGPGRRASRRPDHRGACSARRAQASARATSMRGRCAWAGPAAREPIEPAVELQHQRKPDLGIAVLANNEIPLGTDQSRVLDQINEIQRRAIHSRPSFRPASARVSPLKLDQLFGPW